MPGSILRKVQPYLYLLPLFVLLGVFKLYSSVYAVFRSFFLNGMVDVYRYLLEYKIISVCYQMQRLENHC